MKNVASNIRTLRRKSQPAKAATIPARDRGRPVRRESAVLWGVWGVSVAAVVISASLLVGGGCGV